MVVIFGVVMIAKCPKALHGDHANHDISDESSVEVGIIQILITWGLLLIFALVALKDKFQLKNAENHAPGTTVSSSSALLLPSRSSIFSDGY
jgi:hypothetical protein